MEKKVTEKNPYFEVRKRYRAMIAPTYSVFFGNSGNPKEDCLDRYTNRHYKPTKEYGHK